MALTDTIRQWLDSLDAQASLYATHLSSGQVVAIRADVPVNTLSVIKLPVMVLGYRDADAGRLDLDERSTLGAQDRRRGSGLLQTFDLGLQPTYRDLIAQMIITSDNTATDILIGRLRKDRVNAMLEGMGYAVTRLQTTTNDLFRRAGRKRPEDFTRRVRPPCRKIAKGAGRMTSTSTSMGSAAIRADRRKPTTG